MAPYRFFGKTINAAIFYFFSIQRVYTFKIIINLDFIVLGVQTEKMQ